MDMGNHQRGYRSMYVKLQSLGDPIEVTVRDYELPLRKSRCRNDRGRINTVQDIVLLLCDIREKLLLTYF